MTIESKLVIPSGRGKKREAEEYLFAHEMKKLDEQIGFKLSSRGWSYQLEGFGLITKDEFDKVQDAINRLRRKGLLPIDFTAEEEGRRFRGVEWANDETIPQFFRERLEAILEAEKYYTPDWWDDEEYYIQMVVEKIDLVSLFQPVCEEYHIPIATSSGWASMLMRARYAARFRYFERRGYKCVLLYCGDHDPAGLMISDFLRKNLDDLKNIRWSRGAGGYDPANLIIDRFGLNSDFIAEHNLSWIDNLITGSGKDLASPNHADHFKPYVKNYINEYGARKCEANALVVAPEAAAQLVRSAIEKYLGDDAIARFEKRENDKDHEFEKFRSDIGLTNVVEDALEIIDAEEEKEDEE